MDFSHFTTKSAIVFKEKLYFLTKSLDIYYNIKILTVFW